MSSKTNCFDTFHMTKEQPAKNYAYKRDLMREQLAHRAAKLMAEDGITDHAYAKRKAAKQLRAGETHHLPSNEEIDVALSKFRSLFQSESHPEILYRLREEALSLMHMLAEFRPYLTGSVLTGTAGAQSDINIMLFSDDAKAVLLFLLKHSISFDDGEWVVHLSGRNLSVPCYTLTGKFNTQAHIIVLPENARHNGSRHPSTHADIAAVETLLAG